MEKQKQKVKKERKKIFVPITSKNSASVHILHRENCEIKTEIVTATLHVVFAIESPFEIYRLIFSGHAILL